MTDTAISIGVAVCISLESAILARVILGWVALPAFAAFLAADVLFSGVMLVAGGGWLTPEYLGWYGAALPCVLGLLVAATVEAIGPIPRGAAAGLCALVIVAQATTPAPVETRCAILGACAAALVVSITERRTRHAMLLLWFILAAVVESLAIAMGEVGSLRPAAFLVAAQIVPLVGWWAWLEPRWTKRGQDLSFRAVSR